MENLKTYDFTSQNTCFPISDIGKHVLRKEILYWEWEDSSCEGQKYFLLDDSVTRLMHLRVYDSRDSSRQLAPSPSLYYSLTHVHRSIGYRHRNPQVLVDSASRLMYSRVYDNRDSSHQSAPSPSLHSSLTHAHSTLPTPTLITITCTQVLWFLERLTRTEVSFYETTRTSLTICLPAQPSVGEAF